MIEILSADHFRRVKKEYEATLALVTETCIAPRCATSLKGQTIRTCAVDDSKQPDVVFVVITESGNFTSFFATLDFDNEVFDWGINAFPSWELLWAQGVLSDDEVRGLRELKKAMDAYEKERHRQDHAALVLREAADLLAECQDPEYIAELIALAEKAKRGQA